jgi:hypothetical protein
MERPAPFRQRGVVEKQATRLPQFLSGESFENLWTDLDNIDFAILASYDLAAMGHEKPSMQASLLCSITLSSDV